MKSFKYFNILLPLVISLCMFSCDKDYGNLNSPTAEEFSQNASKVQLDNLVSGTESAMRINLGLYLDEVGVIGREMYRFSTGDPRYTTDLLGASDAMLDNSGFYLTNTWASHYRVVKNCNLLIDAATASGFISDAEKKGYTGFAKTIKAYELLLNLNLTNNNGIRADVSDPDQLGGFLNYDESLSAILTILDNGNTDLANAQVSFPLSSGYAGFKDATGLKKVNRAIAARVDVYLKEWSAALTSLDESFFDLQGDFQTGAYHVFGTGSGDQLNPAFFPQNQAGDVRLAHSSYAADIEANDDRINKATLRAAVASYQGLSSDRDVWVYTSSTAPVPIIRNEELILIYAEANIQSDNLAEGEKAINVIRNGHGLPDYSGAVTKPALITEMLNQRRYSLFYEGHRWVDLRRYGRLDELPVDRPNDDIWQEFPLPVTEQ
ncbi:MAG TPA: RagB/SusD family nutrient uptake outer membrane protein [Flavitalea sp.]|nr:RagB/SusD family nutrient uptake outer membrane protein [Flavitalea sp.]